MQAARRADHAREPGTTPLCEDRARAIHFQLKIISRQLQLITSFFFHEYSRSGKRTAYIQTALNSTI